MTSKQSIICCAMLLIFINVVYMAYSWDSCVHKNGTLVRGFIGYTCVEAK